MYTKETSFSRRMKQAEQHAASLLQQILIFVLIFLVIFMMVQIQNHRLDFDFQYFYLCRKPSVSGGDSSCGAGQSSLRIFDGADDQCETFVLWNFPIK